MINTRAEVEQPRGSLAGTERIGHTRGDVDRTTRSERLVLPVQRAFGDIEDLVLVVGVWRDQGLRVQPHLHQLHGLLVAAFVERELALELGRVDVVAHPAHRDVADLAPDEMIGVVHADRHDRSPFCRSRNAMPEL
ncbi:MAG: hypothetical protein EOO76_09075 [Novosphingobium sp.]|nr:MAG: hypothetical protein EOO76_09075 [Novosphingobium sp.]